MTFVLTLDSLVAPTTGVPARGMSSSVLVPPHHSMMNQSMMSHGFASSPAPTPNVSMMSVNTSVQQQFHSNMIPSAMANVPLMSSCPRYSASSMESRWTPRQTVISLSIAPLPQIRALAPVSLVAAPVKYVTMGDVMFVEKNSFLHVLGAEAPWEGESESNGSESRRSSVP